MTLLVTGAGGQLGSDVVREAAARGLEVVAVDRASLDITDFDAVLALIADIEPTMVVNAAAYTDVDGCEAQPELANAVNGTAVGHLASAAKQVGAHLLTVSTDYVFDGTKRHPYIEVDPPNPMSAYGRSKVLGEHLTGGTATVVRTSWLSGASGSNIVATVLKLLAGDGLLRFVDDQVGSPTFTADLAPVLLDLVQQRQAGIFHATNAGAVSWFEFVREIARQVGADPTRVVPISTEELDPPRPAPRPVNSVLANDALAEIGHPGLRRYEEALSALLLELR